MARLFAAYVKERRVVRILIVDDQDIVRSGFRSIIEMQPAWQVVGEAADGKAAVGAALATRPDIVILDYSLPLLNGVEVTRQIKTRLNEIEVLMISAQDSDEIVWQSLSVGVHAFIHKSDAQQYLMSAISALSERKPFFVGRLSEKLLNFYLNARMSVPRGELSPRERIVVQLIAEGHANREIAGMLSVSIKTVEAQRASALKKLNLTTTAALVRYAVRSRLVEP